MGDRLNNWIMTIVGGAAAAILASYIYSQIDFGGKNSNGEPTTYTEPSGTSTTLSKEIVPSGLKQNYNFNRGKSQKIKRYHRVKSGETSGEIIKRYRMEIADFKNLNPQILNLSNLKSNELVIIYDIVTYGFYEVKRGDNLASIASRYRMYTYEIASLNNISNLSQIYFGQKIRYFTCKYCRYR